MKEGTIEWMQAYIYADVPFCMCVLVCVMYMPVYITNHIFSTHNVSPDSGDKLSLKY